MNPCNKCINHVIAAPSNGAGTVLASSCLTQYLCRVTYFSTPLLPHLYLFLQPFAEIDTGVIVTLNKDRLYLKMSSSDRIGKKEPSVTT